MIPGWGIIRWKSNSFPYYAISLPDKSSGLRAETLINYGLNLQQNTCKKSDLNILT